MRTDIIKLFRPQDGDIVIVDFNKVNVTQVENAVKDLKVPVIAVHNIATIQIWGLREQRDFSQENAELQLELDAANAEILKLRTMVQNMQKPTQVATSTVTPTEIAETKKPTSTTTSQPTTQTSIPLPSVSKEKENKTT